ncbi:MAG: FAD-dependent oxidoreductase, partial [Candidatus Omnitrophica bacterium]|nr:FAD-dependent oxidoreductase [Candidatus Omnitrophota bacterium]
GLAGLSAAWHLQRRGIEPLVFEKEFEPGGLCRSKKIGGFTFDYDAHLLHFRSRYSFDLVKKILGENLSMHKRDAWVYSQGRYIPYPFQANLFGLPRLVIKECVSGFIHAQNNGKATSKDNQNFLRWIYTTFGRGIARHFMIPYNRKFWSVHPSELTCEWLDGFIPVPTIRQLIEGALRENRWQFGYNTKFWYPKKGGIHTLALGLAQKLKHIHTACPIQTVDFKKRICFTPWGERQRYHYLIATIPLPELPCIIRGLPARLKPYFQRLRWNSIFNLNLGVARKKISQRHWIYFPDKEFVFFRAGYCSNFSSSLVPGDSSSLYAEVSYSKDKHLDTQDIVRRIKADLVKAGILDSKDRICVEDTNSIKYAYPIYDRYHRRATAEIAKFLRAHGIIVCGRFGSWRYLSMEGALLNGKEVAEEVLRR